MKLAKFLAHAGVASRRKAEELIAAGKISVNGSTVTNVADRVMPEKDEVSYQGKRVEIPQESVTLLLNKPRGVVSTVKDPDGKPTVMDFIPKEYAHQRLFPVGRLDEDSEGLILLTNDGELAQQLTHPRFETPKKYRVTIGGQLSYNELRRLREGVPLKDARTQPAEVNVIKDSGTSQVIEMVIREGLNRQIRRMMQAVNHPVQRLIRLEMGLYTLGSLKSGHVRKVESL